MTQDLINAVARIGGVDAIKVLFEMTPQWLAEAEIKLKASKDERAERAKTYEYAIVGANGDGNIYSYDEAVEFLTKNAPGFDLDYFQQRYGDMWDCISYTDYDGLTDDDNWQVSLFEGAEED
ncbi:hypothetical protein AGMMS50268_07660 [Spirochaetia bacterium]|nr:hypothetical protein AGMMS50268_07660 [Spirochaetia bacterium]